MTLCPKKLIKKKVDFYFVSEAMTKFTLALFFGLTVICINAGPWEEYKTKFQKFYSPDEDAIRKNVFLAAKEEIDSHNMKYAEGKCHTSYGLNQFSDMVS